MKTCCSLLLILALTGCGVSNDGGNTERAKAMFDAFNRHDWDAMSSYYVERAMFLDPSYGKEYVMRQRKETAEKYRSMEKMFPDIHDAITGIYASGDRVTVEFTSTGTSTDGTSFSLPIVTILTFQNGLIVKDATYYDM